ncbi:MAG: type II toxin-antitoxin system VapC family toxin [Synergistaceae bacterium]|nr:type II toxin-antitoxin system VapC family toxin [Synergistaceae bacterium]
MKVLLDTHILLWVLARDPRLPQKAKDMMTDNDNVIFYSVVSVWETAIKHIKNPAKLPVSLRDLVTYCNVVDFKRVPVDLEHIYTLETLTRPDDAPPHYDPFDRLLIAQAKAENMTLLTHDDKLALYDEPCVVVV